MSTPVGESFPRAMARTRNFTRGAPRALHLDRRMYLEAPEEEAVNPVQSQMDRLAAAFRQ